MWSLSVEDLQIYPKSELLCFFSAFKTLISLEIARCATTLGKRTTYPQESSDNMRPSPRLLLHNVRLTIFTGSNCSLCDVAKATLSKLRERRPFDYQVVDISAKGQERWKKLYQFDIPVLHVQRVTETSAKSDLVTEAKKLM